MNTFQMAGNGNQQVPPLDPALTDGWKPEKPVRSSMEESPKEEVGMNMPTGSMSNIVLMNPQQTSKMIPFPLDEKVRSQTCRMKI